VTALCRCCPEKAGRIRARAWLVPRRRSLGGYSSRPVSPVPSPARTQLARAGALVIRGGGVDDEFRTKNLPQATEDRIRAALSQPGRPGVRKIAKQFGVDPGTVRRISRPLPVGVAA